MSLANVRLAKGLLLLTLLLMAWGSETQARAQDCMKWNNALAYCQPGDGQLADPAWCNGTTLLPLSPAQEVELLSRQYADTPEEALQEWAQYGYPAFYADPTLVRRWDFLTPTQIQVWFEAAPGDGMFDSGESPTTELNFESITRESCCDANVEGPHTDLIDQIGDTWFEQPGPMFSEVFERAPVRGGTFTSRRLVDSTQEYLPQIVLVRRRNSIPPARSQQYASDLLRPGAEELVKFEFFDGFLSNLPWDRRNSEGPEVDHIIPRVDKNGCPCGSNSFRNAQVISAKLNRQLSNNCSDPRRKAIIDFYTKPLPPPIMLGLPPRANFTLFDRMLGQLQKVWYHLLGGAVQ